MAERIPDEKLDEIRQSVDIVDIISDYVQLKRQGRNYFGLCPFHDEKTPSFSVSPEKQIYHCFGCGAGGNVFSFLMDIEGISFQDAALRLAEKVHVELPSNILPHKTPYSGKHAKMIEAHILLKKFYHHLLVNTQEGGEALEYLYARGFTDRIIESFQIGYTSSGKDTAFRFLTGKGFSKDLLMEAGLIIEGHDGSILDRFRERIIFPIFDNKGNTIAFSGRVFKEGEPKYLNSPETIIFQKSKILYNFHQARPAIRKKQTAVLFEGFADCISAYGAGIDNGLAIMGTALTGDHVQLLKRNTDRVIICYDADDAGKNAALKAGEMLQEAGLDVQIAVVSEGKDPDEYIKKNGAAKFITEVIEASQTFINFKINQFRLGKNLENEGERLEFIENVIVEIAKLDSPIEKDLYLRKLAEEFSLSLDSLKQQERRINYQNRKNSSQFQTGKMNLMLQKRDKKPKPAYYNAERMLIAYMLKNIHVAYDVLEAMEDFSFNVDDHQAIVTYLLAYYEAGNAPDLSRFLSFLPDPHLRKAAADIGMLNITEDISKKELTDYVNNVLKHRKMLMIKKMEDESKQAEREKNYVKAAEIAQQIMQLRKTL